jgi:hypothetical protein
MFGLKRERLAGGWSGASQFAAFVKCYLGAQITEDEVEHVACTEWMRKEHTIFIGKP